MTDPTLIVDIVLWSVYLLLGASLAATAWSAFHGIRTHERTADPLAARHTAALGSATAALLALTLLMTYLLASTQPVVSNGQPFTDPVWLRLTDMLIYTPLLLICVCSVLVVIAKFRR